MQPPQYTHDEALAREIFLAMMWALSYPGRIHPLPTVEQPFVAIGEMLLDLETSCHTPDAKLAQALAATGARSLPPETAAYHFYPAWDDAHLASIAAASVGTMIYPDRAATLVIGCTFGEGHTMTWRGVGIHESIQVQVGGIPPAFWELRARTLRYPLGWDVYLVDGSNVIGLPRTTQIEGV
jgi:alpha-D-ribose 1-methylphosphonate 5-triphosphate synthase subunit PhnH